ncbi:HlyD family type I secretion periplasmic adaptor subunit [Pseudomonas silvicola]|nr:HlyD family type I secretion periplasmic adaptor subunit [Pseudomonas silvicola]
MSPSELAFRCREYWRSFHQAWRLRNTAQDEMRPLHEVQFLPAALAIQETPVHPLPRYVAFTLMAFAAIAVLWACIGKLDVVATGTGKIVPSGKSKVIQPNEVAVVKAIHVQDGQAVTAGQLLIELESQITTAELVRLRSELSAVQIDSARAQALLEALAQDMPPRLMTERMPDASAAKVEDAARWVTGQYQEYRSALAQVEAEIEQRSAEIRSAQASLRSLEQTLPITRQLAADYRKLLDRQYVAKHAYLEKEQLRLAQERERATLLVRVDELKALKKAAEHRSRSVTAQTRRAMLDLYNESQQQAAGLAQELIKAERRHGLRQLHAPVDGTVQELAVHTEGGVVTPAQRLMVVVPRDQPLEAQVLLENKDVGFVRIGQPVEIKVETFPFTKYGLIPATVLSISDDAIEDERLGLVYSARLQLGRNFLLLGEQRFPLSPGMAVRAEVITDKRRVISYFLSPLQQHAQESLRER